VRVMPKTGRTHQIRVHMSAIGHALAGDKLYGKKGTLLFEDGVSLERHFLHAAKIEFKAPSGSRIAMEAPLPEDLTGVLSRLESA